MEWVKNMSLKKTFFIILIGALVIGSTLAAYSHIICQKVYAQLIDEQYGVDRNGTNITLDDGQYVYKLDVFLEDGEVLYEVKSTPREEIEELVDWRINLMSFLQIVLPVFIVTLSVIIADLLYYRLKIKAPLELLRNGANNIISKNLDFEMPILSNDELGSLCRSFEVMRQSLLQTNEELWQQVEERNRLNAAFAHDLRNPVAVLKNVAKILDRQSDPSQAQIVDLIIEYSNRIENYIEKMSSIQALEEVSVSPRPIAWNNLVCVIETTSRQLDTKGIIHIKNSFDTSEMIVYIDKMLLIHIIENLITNGLRFAKKELEVVIDYRLGHMVITVMDDGIGFSKDMLQRGIEPFIKGDDGKGKNQHLGMGLYICDLFCKKHGGALEISNRASGGACITMMLKENRT